MISDAHLRFVNFEGCGTIDW